MRRAALALACAVLAAGLIVTAAGAADHTVTTQGGDSSDHPTYVPSSVTINVGDTVTWKNTDGGTHDVRADNGSFAGGDDPITHKALKTPWTFAHQFNQPGTFSYYCSQHGGPNGEGMSGLVIVQSSSPTAPKISGLSAKPGKLCNKKTQNCKHPGTHVKFKLSEDAKVKAEVKPTGSSKPFAKAFTANGHKGKNDVKWSAKGLSPGKYTLRLRATDASGHKSKFATTQVTIKKS